MLDANRGVAALRAASAIEPLPGRRLDLTRGVVAGVAGDAARFADRLDLRGVVDGGLGHVDQRNPEVLVDPEAETDMVWRKLRG